MRNLGVGALISSTLLTKLRAGDFQGAAAEFPRWNKAIVNGVKTELGGLTTRRAQERALFENPAIGASPAKVEDSDQEKIIQAKGFQQNGTNMVAGFDANGNVVEIVDLADTLPQTLIAVLGQYPNLASFKFAKSNETLPAGKHISCSGTTRPQPKGKAVPKLNRQLLVIGMEDSEAVPGNDIKVMQARLKDLGYYTDNIDGIFGPLTNQATVDFQADYFSKPEADGKVGPLTWRKLFGDAKIVASDPGAAAPGKHFLKLTKTDIRDQFGCFILVLSCFRDGLFLASLEVCSGQGRKQTFRKGKDSVSHSMEPLPEGRWSIGELEWAESKDTYGSKIFSDGLGPVKIRLGYLEPGNTGRSAIEMHIDWNRSHSPGTSGCVGLQNISDFKVLASWIAELKPKNLFVDWDKGTCPAP